jgi:CTP:molybdopterin cytidylyltransferase MocA
LRPDVVAIILAAGAGQRLGGVAKALLPASADGDSFLACIVQTLHEVGIGQVWVVVAAPHGERVRVEATRLGLHVVENPHPERGMGASVELGFSAASAACSPPVTRALLWPVDHPWVQAVTVARLLDDGVGAEVWIPTFDHRGGHPVVVQRGLWAALQRCAAAPEGARTILAAGRQRRIPVDDPGVIRDVDEPHQLRQGAGS